MFDNIGSKLKTLAKVECWVGIAFFGFVGLIEMFGGFLSGLLTIGLGVLLSWASSFITYGVGEAVEVGQQNNEMLKQLLRDGPMTQETEKWRNSNEETGSNGWVCKQCGTRNSSIALLCRNCGRGQ